MYFVILFYSILFQACKDMLSWEPFMDLLDEADKCETYSLFIIQGIRQLRREEMLLESVPAMASELRDMFMVYLDGMGEVLAFKKTLSPFPAAPKRSKR